jgi:hypothetical protein
VHGLWIAPPALQGGCESGRPLEAAGNGAELDCLGAVLTLVVGDLARTSTNQRSKRGPTLPNGPVLQRNNEAEGRWKP